MIGLSKVSWSRFSKTRALQGEASKELANRNQKEELP
jgi:hypothetical protein